MKVFRLCKCKYARDLSGRGAEMAGGRWNSKGIAVLYTSKSRALSMVEIAVHTPLGNLPEDYCMVTLEIPDRPILKVYPEGLPDDWHAFPSTVSTRERGDHFITKGKYLIMQVPSAVVAGDHNYLINPGHKDFHLIKILAIEPFSLDKRLFSHQL